MTFSFDWWAWILQGSRGCRGTRACKISSSYVQRFTSYQQCTRSGTTLDFDCEYCWNGSSNRQAKNGVRNYNFSTFDENNLAKFGPLVENDLDLWPMTLKLNRVHAVVKIHVYVKYHQDKCSGSWAIMYTSFLPYIAIVKNAKFRSCNRDLEIRAVVR